MSLCQLVAELVHFQTWGRPHCTLSSLNNKVINTNSQGGFSNVCNNNSLYADTFTTYTFLPRVNLFKKPRIWRSQTSCQRVALDDKSPLAIYSHAALLRVAGAMFPSLPDTQASGLPAKLPPAPQMKFSFSRGTAAWHNALCLGNYFFSACVALLDGHGWLALGGDRWRPLAGLTHVERLWWVSDEGWAG